MSTTFNLLDLVFLIFASIFTLTAFFRGFVKEIFSAFNWAVAFVISYFLTPYAVDFIGDSIGNRMIADMITRSVLFIVVLIIVSMFTSSLCKEVKKWVPQVFDRSLGVFFGIVKTFVIFGFLYSIFINSFTVMSGKKLTASSSKFPTWLKEAKSYDLIKFSGEAVDPAVKLLFNSITGDFSQMIPGSKNNLDLKINEVIDEEEIQESGDLDDISDALKDSGYSKKDIEKMNRLIEIIE